MAIVDMSKLSVIGLNDCKNLLLKEIMDLGVVEINNQESKLSDEEWKTLVQKDGDENAVYELDSRISDLNNALEALNKYDTAKKPLFTTRSPLKEADFLKQLEDKGTIEDKVRQVNEVYKELTALKNELTRVKTVIIALTPWKDYGEPLEVEETRRTAVIIGTMPEVFGFENVQSLVREESGLAEVFKVAQIDNLMYVSLVCLKEDKDNILERLRTSGFNPITFSDVKGRASENLENYTQLFLQLEGDILSAEGKLMEMAAWKKELQLLHDQYSISRDRSRILSNLVKTDSIFYFDGWFPREKEEELKSLLDKNGAYYEITLPEKGEEQPILLKQNAFSEPFEAITNLYSTPSVQDIDPTPYLAPFYFIFFGIMLSDFGYGVILSLGCFILLKKFRLEGMTRSIIKMFLYCGISTAFWGIMFGGYFGDLIPVFAKTVFNVDIVIKPLWFSPLDDPMIMLVFSLVLGVIHLFTGMWLKARILIKNGHLMDAVCDIFLWYGFLTGLVLFGAGGMIHPTLKTVGLVLSVVGGVGILFTGGRNSEKLFGKITGGLGSLYGITGYLSDVLSYARLLALGLATGVVAQVFNTLGSLAGGGLGGAIALLVVFVIGHTFNLAINVLGSFVHSSRLQYVEFFGKFFDGGGKAFNPFSRKTKYVDIIKEEK